MDRAGSTKCFEALLDEIRRTIRSHVVRLEEVECANGIPGFSLRYEGGEVAVCFYRDGDQSQPHLVGPFLLIYRGMRDAPLKSSGYGIVHFFEAIEGWTTDLAQTGYIDLFDTLPSGKVQHHTFTNVELAERLLHMVVDDVKPSGSHSTKRYSTAAVPPGNTDSDTK